MKLLPTNPTDTTKPITEPAIPVVAPIVAPRIVRSHTGCTVQGTSGHSYHIGKMLGAGGMGSVHVARRHYDQKTVAIKIASGKKYAHKCLHQEANVLSELAGNPHIPRLL